jgi:CheY-like chemotaxis protein
MKTILVVDDDEMFRESITELFRQEGYRVVSAENGRDGLARALEEKPDLIVTDRVMPVEDGRKLVLGLRAIPEFRSLPVVMVSGTVQSVALADGRGGTLDVAALLAKPPSWSQLLAAIVGLIGRAEQGAKVGT